MLLLLKMLMLKLSFFLAYPIPLSHLPFLQLHFSLSFSLSLTTLYPTHHLLLSLKVPLSHPIALTFTFSLPLMFALTLSFPFSFTHHNTTTNAHTRTSQNLSASRRSR